MACRAMRAVCSHACACGVTGMEAAGHVLGCGFVALVRWGWIAFGAGSAVVAEQNGAVLRRIEACTTVESCSRRACLAVARQAAIAPALQASDSALVTSESLVASVTQVTSLARTGCVRSYA